MNKIKKEHKNTTEHLKQLLRNSKFFDIEFYKRQNPKLKNTNLNNDEILTYYLEHNKDELIPTSRYFDVKWYVNHNPDIKKSNMDPLIHFLTIGHDEKRLYRYTPINFKALNLPEMLDLYKIYKTIHNSDLFDIDYYLNNNGNFDLENLDPIIHYILIGARCGYNPSRKFNTNNYLENQDMSKVITNPLYHYIMYRENILDKSFNDIYLRQFNKHNNLSIPTVNDIITHLKSKISIIIPIYNAYEETCDCICSVLLNTHLNYELILIDDASTDKRIGELLNLLKDIDNIKVIKNTKNQGFVKNVNTGMREARSNDVVLLNSDTIVTPRWLTKLVIAAYHDPTVATATPLSNNSDISAPSLGLNKDQLSLNKKAYQLSKFNYDSYFESPTGNGFCLYIKRGALNKLGLFDPIFKQGYGEETDFTSKARENGWKNIRTLDTFIYHKNHASFKEKTNQLKAENKKINMKRHPDVFKLWDKFVDQPKLRNILEKTQAIQSSDYAERILYVTQIDKDGKPEVTDEFYEIARKYDTHILALETTGISLFVYDGVFNFKKIYTKKLADKTDDEIKTFYFNLITSLRYDLFYIRQVGYYISCLFTKINEFVKLTTLLEIPVVYEGKHYYDNLLSEIHEKLNPIKSLDETIKDTQNRFSFKDKKVVVYTAITGEYDTLNTPTVVNEDFDYVCFTDNANIKSDFWDVRLMDDGDELDNIRKARKYKILPHKYLSEYDYSIWIDGCFDIVADIEKYIQQYSKNHKLLTITHDISDCAYDEASACINANHDHTQIIDEQIQRYEQEGFPKHNGLIASGILFRDHHDKDVIRVMNTWFNEVKNNSRRDQLSFNYACWVNNFQYDTSNIYYFKNQYFFREDHADHMNIIKFKYQAHIKDMVVENLEKPTTIIIPIYNAYEDTLKCIRSVIKYTNIPYELLLIDDASPDKRINPMLQEFVDKYDNIHMIRNTKNQGFVKNVNMGLKFTDNDVLLLNSDTIVTPNWLSKLKITAYLDEKIGTVTPLSNNSGAFSAPKLNETNLIDKNIGLNKTANIVEKLDGKIINTPTANGFCMYIKRPVIDDVGLFDLGFKRGYGEENDFSMRAIDNGWKNVIDTTTYIYHNESASFGSEKKKLIQRNSRYLDLSFIIDWNITNPVSNDKPFSDEFELIYFNILKQLNIDILHIQNIHNHSFNISKIAHIMGIDVVLSVNDEYYINTSTLKDNILELFDNCSKFIIKSEKLYDKYIDFYPQLKDKTYNIIDDAQKTSTIDVEYKKEDKPINKIIVDNMKIYENNPIITSQLSNTIYNSNRQIADKYIQIYDDNKKENILLIEPMVNNEITQMSSQLMDMLADDYNFYILTSTDTTLSLYEYNELQPDLIEDKSDLKFMKNFTQINKWNIEDTTISNKEIYNSIVDEYKIDFTHIIHMKDHILNFNDIINSDTTMLLSVYDDYYLNYEDNMIDVFNNMSSIIFHTEMLHDMYMDVYDEFENKTRIFNQKLILHPPSEVKSDLDLRYDRPRIVIWDDILDDVDYQFIYDLKSYDVDDTFDLHFIGQIDEKYDMSDIGFVHNVEWYDVVNVVDEINPHFIGMYTKEVQPSLNSLYRAWNMCIPVLRIHNGLVAYTIESEGGGLMLFDDPKAAYERMQKIFNNQGLYQIKQDEIQNIDFSPINEDNDMWNVKDRYLDLYDTKKNILMVIHKGSGGTYNVAFDIMQYAGSKYNFYFLINDVNYIHLLKFNYGSNFNDYTFTAEDFKKYFKLIKTWHLSQAYSFTPDNMDEYEELYKNIIKKYNINMIHIQHSLYTHKIPEIAHSMDLNVVLSLHDFYYICPSYNLLDNHLKFCGGVCTPTENIYEDQCISGKQRFKFPILRPYKSTWKKENQEKFKYINKIIAPSKSTREIYLNNYPEIKDKIVVIGHGYDNITDEKIELPKLDENKPIRILVPGNLALIKGVEYIIKLKSYDVDNRLELHFMGKIAKPYDLSDIGVVHGPYERFEFRNLVEEINPHFIGIFSICPETFSYTLSESWYCGVPVICMNMGALKERVGENGGGLIIPEDPKEAYDTILEFCQNNDKYDELKEEVLDIDIKDRKTMVSEYINIYDEQLNEDE